MLCLHPSFRVAAGMENNMGLAALKKEVREKIINYNYNANPQEDIWGLLEIYDKYLTTNSTNDELAEAAYLRGDAAFHMGRYQDTVQSLTKSLGIEKSRECSYLEADAYNMLGMLFSFMGYETVALDNYLSAIESARKNQNIQEQVASLLNTGLLYQSMQDTRKAMDYYRQGYELANQDALGPDIQMMLLALIQEAILLCHTGKYDDAIRMKREIDTYYHVVAQDEFILSKCMLEVLLKEYAGEKAQVRKLIDQAFMFLNQDSDYLEQIDFYVEFCSFLMEKGYKDDVRKFLDVLQEKLGATEFLHLRMRMEEMEVAYHKHYAEEKDYLEACHRYMAVQQEYESAIKSFKRQTISNIESLQELEKQREEFEMRSRCDLATGLLNKETFQFEVERYLAERNRDLTDAFILVDIDDFKLVNDSFGHLVGDAVITCLSDMIKDTFKENSICGRFGGDEFVIFCENTADMAELEMKVESLRENFAKEGFGKNHDIHDTVSIGVSYNHEINASYKTMFSCADEALLKAKEYGKNRVAFFEIKRGLLRYV